MANSLGKTMLFGIWLKGWLIGVAIAAPVGPIALLCIRRTLSSGRLVGVASGFGAATADGVYGTIAAFGLTALSDQLINHQALLQLMGGAFLCYLGLQTFFNKQAIAPADLSAENQLATAPNAIALLAAYSSTFALTLTNPATIFSFMAVFAGLGITQNSPLNSATLVLGVFTGSLGWVLMLVSGVAYLSARLTAGRLAAVNRSLSRLCGLLLLGFGLASLWMLKP
jgi:threonine/homoserine/homoserine lactone efflux protein